MNALGKVPKALEKELHQRLRRIWDDSEDHTEALAAWQELAMELADEHPELVDCAEGAPFPGQRPGQHVAR